MSASPSVPILKSRGRLDLDPSSCSTTPADASRIPMAPRVVGALLTATALLAPLLLSSQLPPLPRAAVAGSPAPAPAPVPASHHHQPPPRRVPSPASNGAHARQPPPRHQRDGTARHAPPPTVRPSAWWRRLNFGERFGVALAAVAAAMQVALVALLLVLRARQLRRAAAAAAGKAEEEEEAASAAASRPAPA